MAQIPKINQNVNSRNDIQQIIANAKISHPNSVVVYFVKHKDSPNTLPKPKSPLSMFPRQWKVEQVFYALYQQIEVKGLSFYVLKSEGQNMVRYFKLEPGATIGQVFDEYNFNNYLTLIYNKGPIKRWNLTPAQLRIIRILFIFFMVWVVMNIVPYIQSYFSPGSSAIPGDEN